MSPSPPGRYAAVGTAVWIAPDGRQVPYLLRRLLPAPGALAPGGLHLVTGGERIDNIAAMTLGQAELSWLLADANVAMRPSELAARPGRILVIPQPGVSSPVPGTGP